MQIKSFHVENFANLVRPVTLAPLEAINVVYGPNNGGKSNLLRALELYLRILGAGEAITQAQKQVLDNPEPALEQLLVASLNRAAPKAIRFRVTWGISSQDLQACSLFAETPCGEVTTEIDVAPAGRTWEVRVEKWLMEAVDVAQMDRGKDITVIGFAQQIRRLLSDATPFQQDKPVLPFALLGRSGELFPQALHDALFDTRQSPAPRDRRRWTLFAELAGTLKKELGAGSWETTFDRGTGQAKIIYVTGDQALGLDSMGAGIQRTAALLGELCLAREGVLCLEEPEWRLSPEMQQRFAKLARRVLAAGLGPKQLFITTHSPSLAAAGKPFALERRDGEPVLEQKPWALSAGAAADGDAETDITELIGLVEELAEMEPEQLVVPGKKG